MQKNSVKDLAVVPRHPAFQYFHTPLKNLEVCVVLPARNEAAHIIAALRALKDQKQYNGLPLDPDRYEVILLANNCTDATARLARNFAKQFPQFNLHIAEIQLEPQQANIGYVRRLLMDEACRRLDSSRSGKGIIASTDSDTIVDEYWLNNIVYEMSLGCDAVGGRILADTSMHDARVFHKRDDTYRLLKARLSTIIDPDDSNPWPCHYQYFGASLALTTQIYCKCGRLPVVPYLEDMALHAQLVKVDAKIRCSPFVKVYTSARISGRVEVGFSEQLSKWIEQKNMRVVQQVEPVNALLIKLQCRNILRECFTAYKPGRMVPRRKLQRIAQQLLISQDWLLAKFIKTKYFGSLWLQVEAKMATGSFYSNFPPSPITNAISELKAFLKSA